MGKNHQKQDGHIEKKNKTISDTYPGICSTCIYAENCSYIKDTDRIVLQCEEFRSYTESPTKNADKEISSASDFQAGTDINKSPCTFKGLCVDCANRETCTYLKRENGVWHCSEYQ